MLKAAIIGTGYIGKAHAEAYKNMPNVELTAFVDIDENRAKEAAEEFGCACYTSMEDLFANGQADFVDICLPTFLHEEYVVKAAENGKDILCEKPAALSTRSFDRMMKAVDAAGVRFMAAQVIRFWPEYAAIKKMYDQGDFGEIKMVYANRLAQHPNWATWHRDPEKSGGGLFDLHVHDVDYVTYLFGRVKSVYSVGRASETGCWNFVMSILKFEDGNYATVEGIFDMTENYPFTMTFRIVGETKGVEYSMVAGFNLENVGGAKRAAVVYEQGQDPVKLEIDEKDAYQIELEYFADCIESGQPFEVVTPAQSRHTIQVLEAIRKSLETGQVVEVG